MSPLENTDKWTWEREGGGDPELQKNTVQEGEEEREEEGGLFQNSRWRRSHTEPRGWVRSINWFGLYDRHAHKGNYPFFFLRQLKKFGISKVGIFNFYRAVIESVLTFSLIVWFGSSTAQQRSQINNTTRVASKIIGYDLPTIDEICLTFAEKRLKNPERSFTSSQTPLYASSFRQTP